MITVNDEQIDVPAQVLAWLGLEDGGEYAAALPECGEDRAAWLKTAEPHEIVALYVRDFTDKAVPLVTLFAWQVSEGAAVAAAYVNTVRAALWGAREVFEVETDG